MGDVNVRMLMALMWFPTMSTSDNKVLRHGAIKSARFPPAIKIAEGSVGHRTWRKVSNDASRPGDEVRDRLGKCLVDSGGSGRHVEVGS
jgi:hypothetical protein